MGLGLDSSSRFRGLGLDLDRLDVNTAKEGWNTGVSAKGSGGEETYKIKQVSFTFKRVIAIKYIKATDFTSLLHPHFFPHFRHINRRFLRKTGAFSWQQRPRVSSQKLHKSSHFPRCHGNVVKLPHVTVRDCLCIGRCLFCTATSVKQQSPATITKKPFFWPTLDMK